MLEKLKKQVYEANMDLVNYGLIKFTFGNVSGIDRETGIVAIKPSGVDYEALRPEDIVLVSLSDGKVVEGDLRPSSDLPTHLWLYRAFTEIGGVTHTHSSYATAWAQAGKAIPCYGTTHADYFRGDIPCTRFLSEDEIAAGYEAETGRIIEEAFAGLNPMHTPGVLVRGHGPFTWGKSAGESVYHAVVLEETAKIALNTLVIAPQTSEIPKTVQNKHFERKHGKNAYYGQKRK